MPFDTLPPGGITLAALAQLLSAELRLGTQDDSAALVTGVAGIEEAAPGQITFVANSKYAPLAHTTRATAVLVETDFPITAVTTLRVANPYMAFAHAIDCFYHPPIYPRGVHPTAVVSASARIGANAHIGPYVVISEGVVLGHNAVVLAHVVLYPNVHIGDRFFAHAHAVVREHCRLGDDVLLQNGAIVGADGFGFARHSGPGHEGREWHKIPQSGPAVLEDAVEIQANACIDRASIGETRIGAGSKIDNMVQVGHGSTVGQDTLLCAQVGLAGSTKVGNNVILAGQVGVAGHCTIGDGVVATAQSGIPNDVPAGKTVSGYPAVENRQWLRSVALLNRLPELVKRLRS